MMAPLAGKHKSNEDEFGMQLVHAVFTEKPYAKCFEVYYTSLGPFSCPRHEAPWDQQQVIHHIVGFIQISGTHWVGIYTLWICIMKYTCLSYESKQIFISSFSRIHFVIKDTMLMKAWERASILLSPSSSHIYSCCWCHEMAAKYLRSHFLARTRSVCRQNELLYGISHSIRMNDVAPPISCRRRARKEVSCAVRFLWPSL